jgi:DNA replication protein DnaC
MQSVNIEMIKSRMDGLGLTFMSANLDSYLSDKSRDDCPLLVSISDLLDTEYYPRQERMARTRLKVSGIPQIKHLDDFDVSWPKGGISEKKFKELSSLAFINRKENIILMGPSGLGKSHIMLALGYQACMNGYTAYYLTCMDAIDVLQKAKDLSRLKRKLQWMKKPHVLLLDEVGYENLTTEQATLFFQLINSRYESGSVILTTNKAFGKWNEIMGEDAVATATLDRLLHHSQVISLSGESYRMKDRLKIGVVDF